MGIAETTGLGNYFDKFETVNGLRLHYTDWNPSGPDPIVMIHGLNVQAHTWDPIAAALSARHRVICPDLRGHGDSEWAGDGYPLRGFATDVIELCRTLQLERPIIVGHSLGARVAIAFAGEHPDEVSRVLLSDTAPEVPKDAALMVRKIVGSVFDARGFRDEAEALAHYQGLHPEWQPIFHELHVRFQLRRNWAGKLVFKSDPELFWLTGSAGGWDNGYLWEMLDRMSCPTLLMRGRTSPFLDDALTERMVTAIGSAEVAMFETGHYIPRQDPDAFVQSVVGFLERPPG